LADLRPASSNRFGLEAVLTALELAWQAASAPGANDGSLELWINGSPAATLSNCQARKKLGSSQIYVNQVNLSRV
jgi:hypothetical protein